MDLFVIPDGHRRWARYKGKSFDEGYRQLPIAISRVIKTLRSEGIDNLYFWCNSINNLSKRPREQVVSFLTHYLEILEYSENPEELRVLVKGNLGAFDENNLSWFHKKFKELEEETRGNEGFTLHYFVNYTTRDDILRAIRRYNQNSSKSVFDVMDEPPNIDVVLRTGGYRRLSGFYPIKSDNAEMFFTPEYFPDIQPERIREAIEVCNSREIHNGR
jgi:undecaprenyl diphosphate synthase